MNAPAIDAKYVFAILGTLLLVLGALRIWGARSNGAQGRIWMIVGAAFSAVACWLWSR